MDPNPKHYINSNWLNDELHLDMENINSQSQRRWFEVENNNTQDAEEVLESDSQNWISTNTTDTEIIAAADESVLLEYNECTNVVPEIENMRHEVDLPEFLPPGIYDFPIFEGASINSQDLFGSQGMLSDSLLVGNVDVNELAPEYSAAELRSAGPSNVLPRYETPGASKEVICLDNFPGDFNFNVTPERADRTKLIYNFSHQKLFCKPGIYELKLAMDFEKIPNPQGMLLRACVVFNEAQHREKAVQKCLQCIGDEIVEIGTDEARIKSFLQVPRDDGNAYYTKSSDTGRFYLWVPIKSPEAGSKAQAQNFVFSCLTSCKSTGINRRPSTIIFTLLNEREEVVGRSVIGLRVCSAPSRDYENEYNKLVVPRTDRVGRVRKLPGRKPKKASKCHGRIKCEPEAEAGRTTATTTGSAAGAEAQTMPVEISRSSENVTLNPVNGENQSSQEQSSSQETVFTDSEGCLSPTKIRLRRLLRDSREVLQWRTSSVQNKRLIATSLFSTLKTAQDLCTLAREDQLVNPGVN